MSIVLIIFQIIVALGIYNVWFVRANKATSYRGKNAPTLKQEFLAYGLPIWSMYVIGTIKVLAATGLLIGIWIPSTILVSASILAILMLGAISMHIKVRDSIIQTMPAVIMFIISMMIIILKLYV